ncbi:MAG: pyrroloquinoline quinone biosynthesis protein PqqE [Polyangiales bacterium]
MTPPPLALLAELTYRCPLRCGYCSNPVAWRDHTDALDTAAWSRVFHEAAELGALHVHLSGGEPLLRDDLEGLVRAARDAGLYVNLITSAWGLTEARLRALVDAGVDHVQVSVQHLDPVEADRIAGTTAHARKLDACAWVRATGVGLSLNVVLHRANIDLTEGFIALAETVGAERIELANTQYHGSAAAHREALMPTAAQVRRNADLARAARDRLRGRCDVIWVMPDWFADTPTPCNDGWGRRFVTVTPDGIALPCAGAHALPGLRRARVTEASLREIWTRGEDFARYRGTSWMKPPCATCDRREIDFGGCRCQAYALTGDATQADPTCVKSPAHDLVAQARLVRRADPPPTVYRLDARRPQTG